MLMEQPSSSMGTRRSTGAGLVDARESGLWRDLAAHPFCSLFSSPPWGETLARAYGFAISASVQPACGHVEAALLFSHVRDLRGERILCLPFSDYCDPLVEGAASWGELVEPLLHLGVPVRLRCLRNNIPGGDSRFTPHKRAKWHGADLTRPEDELWAGLTGQARQNIRQARRNGVVVRSGKRLEDAQLFHRMHAHLRKTKYRMLAQPVAFFEILHEIFSCDDRLTIMMAELEGVPIAGILLLEWQDTLYYKFNASIEQRFRPNDLMVWEAMLLGHRRGLARLDFGVSDLDQPGLVRYKAKFATEERDVDFLQYLPDGYSDWRGEQASQVLGRVTRLLTDEAVPDGIARAAGTELYRFFA